MASSILGYLKDHISSVLKTLYDYMRKMAFAGKKQRKTARYLWTGPGPRVLVIGHSFIRRLIDWWCRNNRTPRLPFHGEAYGEGGMNLVDLIQLINDPDRNLGVFECVFIQIGENDVENMSISAMRAAMLTIRDLLREKGVLKILFGQVFPRHDKVVNKKINWHNKMLTKILGDLTWNHGSLASRESISTKDNIHLRDEKNEEFEESISLAISSMY